jgi:SP family facilitated glucose transporter-like MFS transporter 3
MTYPLLSAVLVSMLSQFLVGYNTSVMNAPQDVVFPDHTIAQWSVAVAAFAIGGPFGAIAGGYIANRQGRKGALLMTSWIFLVGGLLMGLAMNVYWLIPARFLVGFASGLSSVVVPVYLGEIAPPTLRGTLGTCTQFALVIGILVSSLVAFPLATPVGWRYLFLLTPVLCVVQLLLSSLLLESPR